MYKEKEAELDRQDNLDALEEEHDVLKARSAFYQQQARRYQSREVRAKTYNICKLILRSSGENFINKNGTLPLRFELVLLLLQ